MESLSPPTPPSFRSVRSTLLAALGFGALIFLILPNGVAAWNDDFGYLRSVIETVQHGRPWTSDWLEPWAASFSLLAAGLYRITGSFLLATQGLLALLATTSFWASSSLLQARGHSPRLAAAISALLLTFPTVLWKNVEFTSVALYLPCLLLALRSAEEKSWGRFCLWWGMAIAARQSAVAWAIFPATEIILLVWTSRRVSRRVWAPGLALLAGLGLFGLLSVMMNKTHAQAIVTDQVFARLNWSVAWRTMVLGSLVYLWAAGLHGFLSITRNGRTGPWFVRLLPTAAVLGLLAVARLHWVNFEHSLFSVYGGDIYCWIAVLLGAAGWLTGGVQLRPAPAIAAVGSILVLGLRPGIWDYYLLDVALLGFFGTVALPGVGSAKPPQPMRRIRAWACGILAGFHVLFVLDLKCTVDRAYALCSLAETALRENLLQPTELSFAPFGFTGWHLHRYFIAHQGASDSVQDGFYGYTIPGAVGIGSGYSRPLHIFRRFQHEPPSDRHNLILNGRYRFVWFFHAEHFLLRFKTAQESPPLLLLNASNYHRESFPLNDTEWRNLIEAREDKPGT